MRISRRRAPRVAALALAATLTLAACGAPGGAPGGGQTGGGGDAGGGDAGGTSMLVAMDNGSPTFDRNFNPFSTGKRNTANIIYEPLFVLNNLDGELVPFLGTEFSQPDASTIEVTLREGVTWSDGSEFTAEDVVFTFEMLKEFPTLDTGGVWQQLESVTADGNTVTLALQEENAWAINIVLPTTIVPKALWESVEDPVTYTNENPVGTGPYVLGNFTPNQYTLDRNENYWQVDKVAASQLVLPAANTQLDLVNNDYDWAYAFISDVDNTWVSASEGNAYWFPPGGTIALYPNLTTAPFDNVDVRQGISLALDRARIADVASEGYVGAAGLSGLLLPNQEAWLNPDLPNQGMVEQNVEEALAAFERAGYTQQDGQLVDASGNQLTITINTANGWTDWLRGVQEVQRQLGEIGIEVSINQPQPAAFQQSLQNGDFQLSMGSFGGSGSVYQDFNTLMGGEFYVDPGTATMANYSRYQNADADGLLEQLKVTTDEGEQMDIAHQLQTLVAEDLPAIPLYYGGLWGLFSEARFGNWPSAENPYASPQTWGNNPLLILTNITANG